MFSKHPSFIKLTAAKLRALANQLDQPVVVPKLTVAEAAALRYLSDVGDVVAVDEVSRYHGLTSPHYRIGGTDSTIVLSGTTFRGLIAAKRLTPNMVVTEKGREDLATLDKEIYGDDPVYISNPVAAA